MNESEALALRKHTGGANFDTSRLASAPVRPVNEILKPANWNIKPNPDVEGEIIAVNDMTGHTFNGKMEDFNAALRGETPPDEKDK